MLALLTNDRAGPRAVWNDRKPSTRRELEPAIDGIATRRTRLRCSLRVAMWGQPPAAIRSGAKVRTATSGASARADAERSRKDPMM